MSTIVSSRYRGVPLGLMVLMTISACELISGMSDRSFADPSGRQRADAAQDATPGLTPPPGAEPPALIPDTGLLDTGPAAGGTSGDVVVPDDPDAPDVQSCDGVAEGTPCGETNEICIAGSCVASECGDGYVDSERQEECDDSNDTSNDGCEPGCVRPKVTEVALGLNFSCALFDTGAVKCWGSNALGTLSGAGLTTTLTPQEAPILDFGTSARVTSISAGREHVCALFDNGHVRCWGGGEYGKLGYGWTENYGDDVSETLAALPDLNLDDVIQISAGRATTCALVAPAGGPNGVVCWGRGISLGNGQTADFGDNEPINGNSPVMLADEPLQVETGNGVGCALVSGGEVYCWGSNTDGMLGVDSSIASLQLPTTAVDNLTTDIEQISGVHVNTCARSAAGELWCWGNGQGGRVGYPGGVAVDVPQAPVNTGIAATQVAMGQAHSCFLSDDGAVRCWGNGIHGTLGYGSGEYIGLNEDPADVYATLPNDGRIDLGDFDSIPGWDKATRIYTGFDTSCALMEGGTLRCWGTNTYGQLGYDPAHDYIGLSETPAEAYEQMGAADVRFF